MWAPANKQLVGTGVGEVGRVWFSVADGILTEVFYPTPDQACTRLLELSVEDGARRFEEVRDAVRTCGVPDAEVPLGWFRSAFDDGRFVIDKEIVCDPLADVVLVRVRFASADPSARLGCTLAPALGNRSDGHTPAVAAHKGVTMLVAERTDGLALALACSVPFVAPAAGTERDSGSLVAELDHRAGGGEVTLALGFGRTRSEAAHQVLGSLGRGYAAARERYVVGWKAWHARLAAPDEASRCPLWRTSTTILKVFEAKHPTGGRVAALATPWGPSRGPGLDGTYHLVWTRDMVECATAMLAAGAHGEVRLALEWLAATQEADGHWPQNMRIAGDAVWNHDELDEIALPILFVSRVWRDGLIDAAVLRGLVPMVRRAVGWIEEHGPATVRDRWEDTAGVTPFSFAAAIAGVLAGAELLEAAGEGAARGAQLRVLADSWNAAVERQLYRPGGPLAEQLGIAGYYVRARDPDRPFPDLDLAHLPATELSPDALALVRFGLRAADDPRVVATVRAIDAVLRCDLPGGAAWRRYPGDRYGEHADGRPFDGGGIGRPWPLLTGERAHYELAAGRNDEAARLAAAIESFASSTGCISEQVWDAGDLPALGLVRGQPTRSAAPLGWAHAEYIKLCRSLALGRVFDMPAVSAERYLGRR